MIPELLHLVAGLVLVCFLPGYLLSVVLLARMQWIERVLLSFGLSVVIDVILGFLLTLFSILFGVKGINATSVWTSLILVSGILLFVVVLKQK